MAYFSLEPFGPPADYQRAAMVTAMVANTARDEEKRPEAFSERDFMPESMLVDREDEETDDHTLFEKAKAIFGLFGLENEAPPPN